jgi:hypothetical protein
MYCLIIYLLYGFLGKNQLTGLLPGELSKLPSLKEFYLCKSANISSHEPDTIMLFFGTVLQFISYKVFVDANQLIGDLDPLFCNIHAFSKLYLVADCGDSDLEVNCTCCHTCCDTCN